MEKDKLYELLKSEYKPENWKEILTTIFPKRDFFSFEVPLDLSSQYQKDGAKKIIQFGNITLDDGCTLALYEVELKPQKRIAKNRVELRNLLSAQIIPGVVDGALISYYEKGQSDWRFTFISKSYYWDDLGNAVKKETHPKRYTYVLGKDETIITPRERFWYLIEKRTKTIKDVLEAFSVEKISKEFFAKYKKHYLGFVDALVKSSAKNTLFQSNDKLIRDFVKKMLGRITFLLFLQKKGWLDVPVNEDYGNGNKRFLQDLFAKNNNDAFYTTCLAPLFFETLNNPNDEIYKVTGTKIPFLNGGLFERDEIEKKKGADFIVFTATLFQELFAFFDEYNFTIDESSPDDQDVGIDPEMLGHIFESLLEDNWEKGAFYTPKIIVQYMCQETLIQYLKAHLGDRNEIEDFIRLKKRGEEDAKENFIRDNAAEINRLLDEVKICDPAIGSGAFPMGLLQEIFQAKLVLNWTLQKDKSKIKREIIQNSIYGVDKDKGAVDIARLRFWLALILDEEVKKGEKPKALPNFDYKIMQGDSLFESYKGYSLKYHEEQEVQVQKNLFEIDNQMNFFKKSHGDLVKLEKEYYDPNNYLRKEAIRSEMDVLVAESIETSFKEKVKEHKNTIKALKAKASSASAIQKKNEQLIKQLEQQIEEMQQALIDIKPLIKKEEKPWFLWHLFFKDVFDKGGFDIVIGNPPYIRQESITDIKPYLEKLDGKPNYEVYNSTSDIYTYFFELGHKILKSNNGVLSFICSKKYARAKFGENLREYLLTKVNIIGYVDFNDVQIFGATVDTSIIFFTSRKTETNNPFIYCSVGNDIIKNQALIEYINLNGIIYDSSLLTKQSWSFVSKSFHSIKDIIDKKGVPIKEWDLKINWGIKTGLDEVFIIGSEKKDLLIKADKANLEVIKPILRGRNIKRYKIDFDNQYVIFLRRGVDIEKYPTIKEYLLPHFEKLNPKKPGDKNGRKPGPYKWFEIQDNVSFFDDFEKEKIVWLVLADKPNFAIDKNKYYAKNSAFIATGENLKYLVALFNSKVIEWYFNIIATSSGVGTNRWEKVYVETIPFPSISKPEMLPFEILVDYITFIKKTTQRISTYTTNEHMATNFEELVDACVYELYFKEHMQQQGITVIKEVTELLQPIDHLDEETDQQKIIKIINAVYDEYKSSDSIIRKRIESFPSKSADIINVIQNG